MSSRSQLLVALLLVAALTVAFVNAASGADPRRRACGGEAPNAHVRAAFAIAHARDLQRHYPHMLKTPELDTDAAAYVVDFDGPVPITFSTNPRAGEPPGVYDNVVCVFADGVPNWYYDVDKREMHE